MEWKEDNSLKWTRSHGFPTQEEAETWLRNRIKQGTFGAHEVRVIKGIDDPTTGNWLPMGISTYIDLRRST